jgi:hypothetical protein
MVYSISISTVSFEHNFYDPTVFDCHEVTTTEYMCRRFECHSHPKARSKNNNLYRQQGRASSAICITLFSDMLTKFQSRLYDWLIDWFFPNLIHWFMHTE